MQFFSISNHWIMDQSCDFLLCLLNAYFVIPILLQTSQSNNKPECMLSMWSFSVLLVEEVLLQIWQVCEIPPMCVSARLFNLLLFSIVFPDTLHFHSSPSLLLYHLFYLLIKFYVSNLMFKNIVRTVNRSIRKSDNLSVSVVFGFNHQYVFIILSLLSMILNILTVNS